MSISDDKHDRIILEQIDQNPETTQATLAAQIGVAVGTINWHIRRLIEKGYVKARRVERRKLRYVITPEGLALRARLTLDYINNSFYLYRMVRERMGEALTQVRQHGYDTVRIEGDGDVADVCRLTCMEQGMAVVADIAAPLLEIRGLKVFVSLPGNGNGAGNTEIGEG